MLVDVLKLLDRQNRLAFLRLNILVVCAAIFELLSIGAIVPFMGLVIKPDLIKTNQYLSFLYHFLPFDSSREFLVFVGLAMLASVLTANLLSLTAERAGKRWAGKVNIDLTDRLLRTYVARPYSWFIQKDVSELTSRLGAVSSITEGVLEPIAALATRIGTATFIFIGLLLIDPGFMLVLSTTIGSLYVLCYWYLRRHLYEVGSQEWALKTKADQSVYQAITGIRELKLSGRESYFCEKAIRPTRQAADARIERSLLILIPGSLMRTFMYVALLLATLYLVMKHPDTSTSVPLLSLYAMAGLRLLPALKSAFENSARIWARKPIVSDIVEDLQNRLFDCERVTHRNAQAVEMTTGLELRDIGYTYPGGEKMTFSLSVPKGSRIGIVGATGAGKSTLLGLLSGLLKSESGDFLLDGRPLEGERLLHYRHSLGLVSQSVFALNDTISRNIAFGLNDGDIDMYRVKEALKIAQLRKYVERLEDGNEPTLGDGGIRVSGGQLQRIGIARALYKAPSLMILDEACSHLDPQTEETLLHNLLGNLKDRTLIMVSHRLETMRCMDRIYVLAKGRVVEQGTYDELLNRNDEFRKLRGFALSGRERKNIT